MAVREFDGSDDSISVSGGALGAICNGAYSIVVTAKPNAVSPGVNANKGFVSIQISTTDHLGGLNTEDGTHPQHLALFTDAGAVADDVDMDASWQILGLSKSSGTTSPRFHRKALGSGSWSHASPGGTMADQAGTATRVEIGKFMGSGNNIAGRMAVVAVFLTELSDASFESIQTTPSTQKLFDLGAVGLWDLNQASTATAVTDLTGGGANETAITGTTVVGGDDPPGWTFGLGAQNQLGWIRA